MIEIKKLVLAITLLVLSCSLAIPLQTTHAAKTTEMYVNAKTDIFLRSKPDQHANKLGSIQNHSTVTVLSSKNGWSYVQAGKNKGYVYTSALSKNIPKAAPSTVTKGLTPVDGLILTYAPSILEDKKETFYVEKEDEFTYLYNRKSPLYPELSNFTYMEDNNRLMMGVSSSDFIFVNVPYPLKQGTYVTQMDYFSEEQVLVESTTKTITVKAGTFRNVVILRYSNGSRAYFAKGIGLIKITAGNGKVTTELVSVKVGK
ncbi:SH3 domain-containing protein [Sporosarcina obsidiansis]|uniref:SH3 domain-containing protein n=1 Tax=Sporosarcina obsidiansis TaxID=2660748 RepID=UPI00129AE865|nr:SH3 domain-containing protein [Sporosarcina obsidiansis]